MSRFSGLFSSVELKILKKLKVWNWLSIIMRPIRKPKSPILFKINALFPALDADFFSDQNEIKR